MQFMLLLLLLLVAVVVPSLAQEQVPNNSTGNGTVVDNNDNNKNDDDDAWKNETTVGDLAGSLLFQFHNQTSEFGDGNLSSSIRGNISNETSWWMTFNDDDAAYTTDDDTLLQDWSVPEEYRCTESYDEFCANTNQLCWKRPDDNMQACGACLPGYVDWDVDQDVTTVDCRSISDLSVQQFWEFFSPVIMDPNFNKTLEGLVQTVKDVWNSTGSASAVAAQAFAAANNGNLAAQVPSLQERLEFLQQRARLVAAHNRQIPPPKYSLGLNAFAMDSANEQNHRLGYQSTDANGNSMADLFPFLQVVADSFQVPAAINWVERGAVTSVKNQGNCGCCWSISIAGAIEGAAAIGSNFTYLQSVSFQQLISCLTPDKNSFNCNGGFTGTALLYAIQNSFGGMTTLNHYPFQDGISGNATKTCALPVTHVNGIPVEKSNSTQGRQSTMPLAVTPKDASVIVHYDTTREGGNETRTLRTLKLKHACARQPVSISMHAECSLIYSYQSGIITDDGGCRCFPGLVNPQTGKPCLNHAVLLVGYNDTPADMDGTHEPYWLIKNSWGPEWGEAGYFRVAQRVPSNDNYGWGLFGILAEGLVPLIAYNATLQEPDLPQGFATATSPAQSPPPAKQQQPVLLSSSGSTNQLPTDPALMDETWEQILWALFIFVGSGGLAVAAATVYHKRQNHSKDSNNTAAAAAAADRGVATP